MCNRPSMVMPERESIAIIQSKENVPSRLMIRILWKPCACSEGFVARSPGNNVWSIAERIPDARQPHPAILKIMAITKESNLDVVDAIIPSWNPKRVVRFPVSNIPKSLHKDLKPATWLLADVNIGAIDPKELFFENFRAAPELDSEDGLS